MSETWKPLADLLAQAKERGPLTDEERSEQRANWARGEAAIESGDDTRRTVAIPTGAPEVDESQKPPWEQVQNLDADHFGFLPCRPGHDVAPRDVNTSIGYGEVARRVTDEPEPGMLAELLAAKAEADKWRTKSRRQKRELARLNKGNAQALNSLASLLSEHREAATARRLKIDQALALARRLGCYYGNRSRECACLPCCLLFALEQP